MDMEYTFWQMRHLCTSPKVVYQQTKYHKQTKNQWARDDPAFTVICGILLAVAVSSFCAAYGHSVAQAIFTVASVVILHFLLAGISLATICWFLSNHYLREEIAAHTHVVEQRVEWYGTGSLPRIGQSFQLYAFDVHCNSYFPLFVILYVLQYFLSPLLLAHGFVPTLLSNMLYFVALSYYHYLNFLGYDVLPFLERTIFFLYPIGILVILFPLSLLAGFNPCRFAMNLYFE
nr:protein unc-50 homolog isoform X3 [Physcomitrium patens]|eukprot:XP_024360954.1 protein unc-50 homolog isoform X3 [Physcomitrella patens]